MPTVKPIPDGYHTLTPHMVVRSAKEAIEYYKQAFGAELVNMSLTPDGQMVMNAELKIGDSMFMIADELPMMEYWVSPSRLNGTTTGIHLFVEDVDSWYQRAYEAGIKVLLEPQNTFWGDRYCQFIDKFGHAWSIATRKEDLDEHEISERAKEWFAKFGNS